MTTLRFDLLPKDVKAEVIKYLEYKDLTRLLKVYPYLQIDEKLWLSVITIHNSYYPSYMTINLSESSDKSYYLLYLQSIMKVWTFDLIYEVGDFDPNDIVYVKFVNISYDKCVELAADDMIELLKEWLLDGNGYEDIPFCNYLIENNITGETDDIQLSNLIQKFIITEGKHYGLNIHSEACRINLTISHRYIN